VNENITSFGLEGYQVPSMPTPRSFWTNGSHSGMADYTNPGFVSAGTNFTELRDFARAERYTSPYLSLALTEVVQPTEACRDGASAPAPITNYGNRVFDALRGRSDFNPRMTTYSIFDQRLIERGKAPMFALNCFNIDAQANLLLRRAVGYSAGLLRHFFRGRLGLEVSGTWIRLLNALPNDAVSGTFELFYDDQSGPRRRLAGWTLELFQNQYSEWLSSPGLPPSYAGAVCQLVFRGRIGQEENAVAGTRGPCPIEYDVPPPDDPDPPPDGGEPVPPTHTSWWCIWKNANGWVSGEYLVTVPVPYDPYSWLEQEMPPGASVVSCREAPPGSTWVVVSYYDP
jgi:hypothetical protein